MTSPTLNEGRDRSPGDRRAWGRLPPLPAGTLNEGRDRSPGDSRRSQTIPDRLERSTKAGTVVPATVVIDDGLAVVVRAQRRPGP